MNSMHRMLCAVVTVLSLQSAPTAMAEIVDPGPDVVYAEDAPLAAHSLLLDVIRVGSRLVAAGERGHIVYSDDEGATWTQAEVVPTRSTLTALHAAGERMWAAGHDSVIVASVDRGRTWTRQYFDPERQQPIMDLHFSDSEHGIAVGAYGLMLVTSNGGQQWDDLAVSEEDDAHLNAIHALPNGILVIAGEAGFSYRSQDGGESWEAISLPYEGSMFGVIADNVNCLLMYGLRGHVLRSCDSGVTWEEIPTGIQTTLLGSAVSGDLVLLVGNGGIVLKYQDGQFIADSHPSGVDFSGAIVLFDGRFLLIGEEGSHFYPVMEPGEIRP